jgi:tetratricopeptide (TPR) repeat protein
MRFKGESVIYWTQPHFVGKTFKQMLIVEPSILLLQITQMVVPHGLSADYGVYSIRYFPFLLAVPALLMLTVGAVWGCRKSRALTFSLLLFLVLMGPVSNLIPKYQAIADRFLYLPMVSVSLLAAVLFHNVWHRLRRPGTRATAIGVYAVIAVTFSVLTVQREGVWQNSISLWTDAHEKNPLSSIASDNLGYAYLARGDYERAVYWFNDELSLSEGKSADGWTGMALVQARIGDWAQAVISLRKAGDLNHRYKDPERLAKSLRWTKSQVETIKQIAGLSPAS